MVNRRRTTYAILVIAFVLALASGAFACQSTNMAYLNSLDPSKGPAGATTTASGGNWNDGRIELRWGSQSGPVLATVEGPAFVLSVHVPNDAQVGIHHVYALQGPTSRATTFEVTSTRPTTEGGTNPSANSETTTTTGRGGGSSSGPAGAPPGPQNPNPPAPAPPPTFPDNPNFPAPGAAPDDVTGAPDKKPGSVTTTSVSATLVPAAPSNSEPHEAVVTSTTGVSTYEVSLPADLTASRPRLDGAKAGGAVALGAILALAGGFFGSDLVRMRRSSDAPDTRGHSRRRGRRSA